MFYCRKPAGASEQVSGASASETASETTRTGGRRGAALYTRAGQPPDTASQGPKKPV